MNEINARRDFQDFIYELINTISAAFRLTSICVIARVGEWWLRVLGLILRR